MSELHKLKPHPKSKHRIKRVGRGPGSGVGKTSGRGHKGQLQRGPGARPGFEGGQMPIIRTMPKRGFTARSKEKYEVINLDKLNSFQAESVVDVDALKQQRIVRHSRMPIKILGQGEIKVSLNVKVHAASRSAQDKIKKAGGTFTAVLFEKESKNKNSDSTS